jgi:glutaminyl-peptide cyclotransferase
VLQQVPHDTSAFTEGLVIIPQSSYSNSDSSNNVLVYEGTGLYGHSQLRSVDLTTGQVLQSITLNDSYFGEGIAYYEDSTGNGRIVQLTWKEQTAFIYDSSTLKAIDSFTYSTTNSNQGWGITVRNGTKFVVSDGSAYLHTWDMTTFQQQRRVQVTLRTSSTSASESATPIRRLNELEWDPYTDTILSNVWLTDVIVRIDPDTGLVLTQYDMKTLFPNRPSGTDVMNGIALVPNTKDEFWITGKKWPFMFRVRLL